MLVVLVRIQPYQPKAPLQIVRAAVLPALQPIQVAYPSYPDCSQTPSDASWSRRKRRTELRPSRRGSRPDAHVPVGRRGGRR